MLALGAALAGWSQENCPLSFSPLTKSSLFTQKMHQAFCTPLSRFSTILVFPCSGSELLHPRGCCLLGFSRLNVND